MPSEKRYATKTTGTMDLAKAKDFAIQTWREWKNEVGALYWTALAPEIVNSGREEQGSVSV